MRASLTLTVESIEAWSAGVTVVASETLFADAGPSAGVRPARVVHGACGAALTVCTENVNTSDVMLQPLWQNNNDNSVETEFDLFSMVRSFSPALQAQQTRKQTGRYEPNHSGLLCTTWNTRTVSRSVLSHSNSKPFPKTPPPTSAKNITTAEQVRKGSTGKDRGEGRGGKSSRRESAHRVLVLFLSFWKIYIYILQCHAPPRR